MFFPWFRDLVRSDHDAVLHPARTGLPFGLGRFPGHSGLSGGRHVTTRLMATNGARSGCCPPCAGAGHAGPGGIILVANLWTD